MGPPPARLDGFRLLSPAHGGLEISFWGSFHDLMLIIIIIIIIIEHVYSPRDYKNYMKKSKVKIKRFRQD